MLGVPINAVDDPERCSVIFPSVHRDGPLVVAVSTSGAAPAVAVRLRERIAEMTVGYGSWLDTLREFRGQIRGRFTTFAERRDVWYRIADSPPVADAGRRGEQSTTRRLVQDVIDDFATNVCVKSAVIESDAVRRAERRIEEALAVSRSPVITCSMQVGGLVLVDLVRGRAPDVRVVFVDTGYHFSETLAFRDRVADEWDLQIDVVGPGPEVREPLDGPPLHITDPVRCCQLRKVAPADGAIAGHDLWLSSLRRIKGTSRASVPADAEHVLTDDWSWADVVAYADARGVPRHPLYDGGYSSIGCEPCTVPTFSQGDDRRGRWDGTNVQECGLHISKGRS